MASVLNSSTTRFKSLPYRSGIIYNFLTQRLYDQKKKYSIIARHIGNGKIHVLDIPCGTGFLARYLHSSTIYEGWDLNKKFLKKIKTDWKKKRIKVRKIILKHSNIFEIKNNTEGKRDVIVLCDILHHIMPHHVKLINLAKQHARKVIICEPFTTNRGEIQAHDFLGRFFIYIFKFLPVSLFKLIDFFLIDNDGVNSFEKRTKWKFTPHSMKLFFEKLGFDKFIKVGDNIISICTPKRAVLSKDKK
ncbi:MAG: methyltransferase domain-containing protein [Promethearchaeota archaeon]